VRIQEGPTNQVSGGLPNLATDHRNRKRLIFVNGLHAAAGCKLDLHFLSDQSRSSAILYSASLSPPMAGQVASLPEVGSINRRWPFHRICWAHLSGALK